jgi:hypothetical protein
MILFLTGLWIGASVGLVVAGLCRISREHERQTEVAYPTTNPPIARTGLS